MTVLDSYLSDVVSAIFPMDSFNCTNIQTPENLWAGVNPHLVPNKKKYVTWNQLNTFRHTDIAKMTGWNLSWATLGKNALLMPNIGRELKTWIHPVLD